MPMFPLGFVLLPGFLLPLHVFEPRFRALTRHCLDHDAEFGVVLIERGSEVGGGDVRTSVGVAARIVDHQEQPDGRFSLVVLGQRRIRINRWLSEEPYPLADVEPWPDREPFDVDLLWDATDEAMVLLRQAVELHVELGDAVSLPHLEPDEDLVALGHRLCGVAPFGPADQQRLLTSESPEERVDALAQLLCDDLDDLSRRRELGS